ncbi:MAG: hypothetical protein RSE58_11110 [Clostridia bacterium]
MRTAVIGIGSNSLRMLVADITNGRLHRLRRYREGLRVFAALDDQGNITQDMIDMACKSVVDFRNEALAQGAEQLCLFATSAVRDARNQQVLISALEKTTGLELDICSGEQEALLSFIGATEGQRTGMIDIGGGSTEIVVGYGKEMLKAVSLQMGAVRLCRKQPINSVATAEEVVKTAESMLLPYQESFLALNAENWMGVGGTFTTSAAFVQKIPLERRDSIHGFVLTQKDVRCSMEQLAPMPMEQRLQLPYLQPQRADIVVHGIAILLACMNVLHMEQIVVSEHGNLEGYLKTKYLLC